MYKLKTFLNNSKKHENLTSEFLFVQKLSIFKFFDLFNVCRKNCLHYTDTFLAKSKKASKQSVKRRFGAPFTVERRERVPCLLSCSRKTLFTFFSCALDFCAATACFKVVFHRKKIPVKFLVNF